jgi:hypothetical protein
LFAIVAVALFGGLIGGVGLAGGFAGPMRDEVIKDLLQVAIVGVLGAALTVAVNGLQVRRDTRRQADELMRTWMGEVITIYQKVRVSRWWLQVLVAGTDGDRCVTVADLDTFIPIVNDARLRFDRMRELCATQPAHPWPGMVADLKAIQTALRPVCEEYRVKRSTVAGPGSVPLAQLPQLRNFLDEYAEFKGLCGRVRRVIETLRDTLLRLPTSARSTTPAERDDLPTPRVAQAGT